MKNLSKYSMWLVLILAIGLFASGCGSQPFIDATDGDANGDIGYTDKIVVTWSWDGGLGDTLAAYVVLRATSPFGTFVPVSTPILKGQEEYVDNVPGDIAANTAYFYRVIPYTATEVAGDPSYINGGVAGDTTKTLHDCMRAWSYTDQCIHQHSNSFLPDPMPPVDITMYGTTGSFNTTLVLDTTYGLDAIATFTFTDYLETCTNSFTFDGVQSAPVSVPDYDGKLLGLLTWTDNGGSCDGWTLYDLDIVDKQSVGGVYYAGDGASVVECHQYAGDLMTPGESCPCDNCDCCPPSGTICPWPAP